MYGDQFQKAPACCLFSTLGSRLRQSLSSLLQKTSSIIRYLLLSNFSMKGILSSLCISPPPFWETFPGTWKNQLEGSCSHSQWVWKLTPEVRPALLGPLLVPRMLLLPFVLQERILGRRKERKPTPDLSTVRNPILEGQLPQPHTMV